MTLDGHTQVRFDPARVPATPAYVLDEGLLRHNLAVLADVRKRSGAKILLALKAFAMFRVFGLLGQTLNGVCASSPHEARLGREKFGQEVHTFAAGYSEKDILDLCQTTDHLVFNSLDQFERLSPLALAEAKRLGRSIDLGLRINPEHSEGAVPLYDPCAPGSRLGIRRSALGDTLPGGVRGLHFHTLCEQGVAPLQRTLQAFENQFGPLIKGLDYVNFGGGHHITRPDYNTDLLVELIVDFRRRYGVEVYLEPGEAVALNTGYLVTEILDVVQTDTHPVAIMDTAVPCHMPDVIEMPYRPVVVEAGDPGEKAWTCALGGPSCLAGDMAGEFSFDVPLRTKDRLVFTDMAHYTMVKTNTFNGIGLPDIVIYHPQTDEFETVREFGYLDFKNRLS